MKLAAALATALLTLTLVYCGKDDPAATSCKSDAECLSTQRCDVVSGACVDKAQAGSDASSSIPPDASEPGPDASSNPGADASTPDTGAGDTGVRGCTATNECAVGQACDLTVGQCVNTCGAAQPCNGGCCDATGHCQKTSAAACGTASCQSCTAATTNHACVTDATAGLKCGCNTEADCAAGQACNKATHACSATCSTTQTTTTACKDACCSNGSCLNSNTACGPTCTNCQPTTNANNKLCLGGTCGCNSNTDCATGNICDTTKHVCTGCSSNADCPRGQSCNPNTKVCSTDCTVAGSCNGACCPAGTTRTCQNVDTACGATCTNCTANNSKPACLGGVCGCASSADCAFGMACNGGSCTTACNPAAGIRCNGGCCSNGTCVGGFSRTACGDTGGNCFTCASLCCGDSCGVLKYGCP